jgi:hypothetical protein
MKTPAYRFLTFLSFASIGAAGLLGACGADVTQVTGGTTSGTGTHGTGGAPSTTDVVSSTSSSMGGESSVSVSVSVTTDQSASSSTGGNDCQNACDKATMCGLDLCKQFGVDCAMPNPMFACPEKCISVATCDDIMKLANNQFNTPLGLCLFGCQGMGPASSSSSGMATGGAMQCGQCLNQACAGTLQACATDFGPNSTHCAKWLQCENTCYAQNPTPQCFFDCDAANPGAAGKYQPVYDCACNSCPMECGPSDPCNHNGMVGSSSVAATGAGGAGGAMAASSSAVSGAGGAASSSSTGGGSAMQCNNCAVQQCAGAVQTCFFDNTCQKWLNCAQGCGANTQCTFACDMTYASAAGLYKPVYACECNKCINECGGVDDPCNH